MDSKEENGVDGNRGETTEPVDEAIIGLIMQTSPLFYRTLDVLYRLKTKNHIRGCMN